MSENNCKNCCFSSGDKILYCKHLTRDVEPDECCFNFQQKDDSLFDIFWKAYPKKKDKADARKAFMQLNPDKELLTVILTALEKQKNDVNWVKEKRQYMPYPAKYLRHRRWEDEDGETCGNDAEDKAFGTFL